MFGKKLILSVLTAAICVNVVVPSYAATQTIYVPASQLYVGGATGQTIIVKENNPQTIVVRENVPQTVVVRETVTTPTYYPTTTYVSDDTWIAAGVTGLVGGVLLGALLNNNHHKHKRVAPPPPNKHHGGRPYNPPRNSHGKKPHHGR